MYTKHQDIALVVVRVVLAVIFLHAGYVKFPFWSGTPEGMSETMANLMKLLSVVEPLGALALIGGLLTRWAASGLAVIMVGAIFILQFMMGTGFTTATGPGWSYPLMVFAGCIALVAFGAGSWSVDAKRAHTGRM